MKLNKLVPVAFALAAIAQAGEPFEWQEKTDPGPLFIDAVGQRGSLMWKDVRFVGLGLEIWAKGRKAADPEPSDWPLIYKNISRNRHRLQLSLSRPKGRAGFYTPRAQVSFETAPMETYFGTIRPTFARQWNDMLITGDWAHAAATYEYTPEGDELGLQDEGKMRIIVSRLTPAALITVYGLDSLRFFEHDNPLFSPARYFMTSNDEFSDFAGMFEGKPHITDSFEIPDPESLEWMLAWGEENVNPFLLLFFQPPLAVEIGVKDGRSGCTVEFGADENHVALISLFGDSGPPPDFTKTVFSDQAYFQTLAQTCARWRNRLGAYPVGVRESYSYDEKTDTAVIAGEFEFITLMEAGEKFAPVPPMMSLAADAGFPIEFSADVLDLGMTTDMGPIRGIAGADKYEMRIRGMGKYLFEELVPGAGAGGEELGIRLEKELDKMIEADGLAYVILANSLMENRFKPMLHPHFMNPAETLVTLALVYDLVKDDALKERIEQYMVAEESARPCLGPMPLDAAAGARRERYFANPADFPEITEFQQGINFYKQHGMVPPENAYAKFQYERIAGDMSAAKTVLAEVDAALLPYLKRTDWAGGVGYFQLHPERGENIENTGVYEVFLDPHSQFGGVGTINGLMSGLIGCARLARAAGDNNARDSAAGLFARAAAVRHAMGCYPRYLHESGLMPQPESRLTQWRSLFKYGFQGPRDNPEQIARMDQRRPVLAAEDGYTGMLYPPAKSACPEVCRFLADHLRENVETWLEVVEHSKPDWWLNHYTQMFTGGEKNFAQFDNSFEVFAAKTMIAGDNPENLAIYADSSWLARGDLYYIRKLAMAIYAARGMAWRRP